MKKDFDKAVVIAENNKQVLAAIGKSTDAAPSAVAVFEKRLLQEGKPFLGEVLATQAPDGSYDITHLSRDASGRVGPAKVASPSYRTNYDRIFGQKNRLDIN